MPIGDELGDEQKTVVEKLLIIIIDLRDKRAPEPNHNGSRSSQDIFFARKVIHYNIANGIGTFSILNATDLKRLMIFRKYKSYK